VTDLSGTWRAAVADEDLRRAFPADDLDDDSWEPIAVPGHWRSTAAFADTDGPLLYRTRFEQAVPSPERRSWLVLDGLFYQGDIWLDGGYLGDTEGYFFPHGFEVTDALRAREGGHTLAVEVACNRPTDRTAKRNITGVFQHWDCLDPQWNPGGIWRPVRVEETGPVRVKHFRLVCREATPDQAVLALRAVLDTVEPRTVVLRTTCGAIDHENEQPLAAGENQVEWTVPIPNPTLWWPHALGDQALCDATVEVLVDGVASDSRCVRVGLRRVELRGWVCSVNGERLFLKGANQGPTRMALAEATPEELAGDVKLAVDAGLDLLRIHAHITRPELYDAADEAGLLLWQDFPLQWGYARGIRKQAARQAREAVDLLGHHPSVAIWCAHNEPMALDVDPSLLADPGRAARAAAGALALQQLPTWNKSVLDRSVKRAIERADGSRPVIAHSGVLPHLPKLDGTDSHLYFGWYWGDERDFPGFCARMPRLARFVTEFGAQAVPESADFCEPDRWPDLDWKRLGDRHCLQRSLFDRYVPPSAYETFDSWRAATQAYQATVVKHHVETLRRLKYRPTGGFAQFCLADGMPAVTWAVLGHDRRPKAGYAALAEACRPVIVVADRLPAQVEPGDPLGLDVHVVSDLRHDLGAAIVTATLSWPGGSHEWRWIGDINADSCARVGTIQAVVAEPDGPGDLVLTLDLDGPAQATNRYSSRYTLSNLR
jgi:beta-mannosidase